MYSRDMAVLRLRTTAEARRLVPTCRTLLDEKRKPGKVPGMIEKELESIWHEARTQVAETRCALVKERGGEEPELSTGSAHRTVDVVSKARERAPPDW